MGSVLSIFNLDYIFFFLKTPTPMRFIAPCFKYIMRYLRTRELYSAKVKRHRRAYVLHSIDLKNILFDLHKPPGWHGCVHKRKSMLSGLTKGFG